MSLNISGPGISPLAPGLDTHGDNKVSDQTTRPGSLGNAVQVRSGPLTGNDAMVGDGAERNETLRDAGTAKSFFKALAQPFVAIGQTIKDFFSTASREARLDQTYAARNTQMLQALSTPMAGSILEQEGVLDNLQAHAKTMHTPISPQQIKELVATGERLTQALRDAPSGGSPVNVTGQDGQQYTMESGIHTTRALSWYMMAAGALQDAQRDKAGLDTPSAMPTNGSMVMKDPDNRVYEFLTQAPTASSRMSTHFNERSATESNYKVLGLFSTSKPEQRGIEDYRNMLPGQGGTVLFDKLQAKDGSHELFVKFEHGGCPPFFGGREKHEGVGASVSRFFPAMGRNLGHALSFLQSRGDNLVEGRRQEHVHKGLLKESVYTPFNKLVSFAQEQGVELGQDPKSIAKSVTKTGLPVVHTMLARIAEQATAQGRPWVADEARQVQEGVEKTLAALGQQTDQYGIERRGGEVHIELDPSKR